MMERRRTLRVPTAPARARVLNMGRWSDATVTDLSLLGAQLEGEDLPAPGSLARLHLKLAGRVVRLDSVAVWHRVADRRGAVAFDPLSPTKRRRIAVEMVRAGGRDEHEDGATPAGAQDSPSRRAGVAEIPCHGFTLSVALTPLAASGDPGQTGSPPPEATVSTAPDSLARERLADVLAAEHPAVRRVLLLDDTPPSDQVFVLWSSTDDDLEAMLDLVGHSALADRVRSAKRSAGEDE